MQLLAVKQICLKQKALPMRIPFQTKNTSRHDPKPWGFFVYKGIPQLRPTVQTVSQPKAFLLLPVILTSINLCNHDPSFPSGYPCADCSPNSRVQHIELSSSHQRPHPELIIGASCLHERIISYHWWIKQAH